MKLPRPSSQHTLLHSQDELVTELEKILSGTVASGVNADKLDGIDSLGFLQLAVTASREVAFGSGAIALVAANAGNVNVTHGLNAAPAIAICQLKQGSAAFAYLDTGTYGATTFNVACLANGVVTGNINFDWLAIA